MPDDHAPFDELLASAASEIGDMVTGALHRGVPLGDLAIVVERRFNGQVTCGCALRQGLVATFPRWGKLAEGERHRLATELKAATADELLLILIIHEGEGLMSVRVRRDKGEFVAVQ